MREHRYRLKVRWTGNRGTGTSGYAAYGRDHELVAEGKAAPIPGSSDPKFRGDASRYNPEELLLGALSACHMLWALHLAAAAGVVVVDYEDRAEGTMSEEADGGGRFSEVVLRPRTVLSSPADAEKMKAAHERAHHLCFIARSVNFPVRCEPEITA